MRMSCANFDKAAAPEKSEVLAISTSYLLHENSGLYLQRRRDPFHSRSLAGCWLVHQSDHTVFPFNSNLSIGALQQAKDPGPGTTGGELEQVPDVGIYQVRFNHVASQWHIAIRFGTYQR